MEAPTVPELPTEILLIIMELLASRRCRRTLLSLGLASRAAWEFVRPVLHRKLEVTDGNYAAVMTLFAYEGEQGPRFRELVLEVDCADAWSLLIRRSPVLAEVHSLTLMLRGDLAYIHTICEELSRFPRVVAVALDNWDPLRLVVYSSPPELVLVSPKPTRLLFEGDQREHAVRYVKEQRRPHTRVTVRGLQPSYGTSVEEQAAFWRSLPNTTVEP